MANTKGYINVRRLSSDDQLKNDHSIAAMADIVYTENGKQYLGLPGQAFPIYYRHGGHRGVSTSMWIYSAIVENQEGKFLLSDRTYQDDNGLSRNPDGDSDDLLGGPGTGIHIMNFAYGLPGLATTASWKAHQVSYVQKPMYVQDFFRMSEMGRETDPTIGERWLPSLYVHAQNVTDPYFKNAEKHELLFKANGIFTSKWEKGEFYKLPMPVVISPLENVIRDSWGATSGNIPYDAAHMVYRMLDAMMTRLNVNAIFIGRDMEYGIPSDKLVERHEYNQIMATPDSNCRYVISASYCYGDPFKYIDTNRTELLRILSGGSIIPERLTHLV